MSSEQTNFSPFGAMPYAMVAPAWIEQSAAFLHEDARLAKGYVQLYMAAWRGTPAATIPNSVEFITGATGLPADFVRANYSTLTDGFFVVNNRLQHGALAKLAAELSKRYGKAIEEFALSTAMSAQAPDLFGMVAVETATPKTTGKTSMPRNFGYGATPALETWAINSGLFPTVEDRAWIMERFHEYVKSKSPKYVDWEAGFKVWARKEVENFGHKPPSMRNAVSHRPAGGGSAFGALAVRGRGEIARDHNASVFAGLSTRSSGAPGVVEV